MVQIDTSVWPDCKGENKVWLPRLQQALGKDHFRLPPVPEDFRDLSNQLKFQRFPRWLFCPKGSCRKMFFWRLKDEKPGEPPECPDCRRVKLVPMRFITVCEDGHMDDVDWHWWVHCGQTNNNCQTRTELKFYSKPGMGAGLASLFIKCSACNAEKSLAGIASANSMQKINRKCTAKQPWQRSDDPRITPCEKIPQVVQRGASNVHFPKIHSALDIKPPQNENDESQRKNKILTHPVFAILKTQVESEDWKERSMRDAKHIQVVAEQIAKNLGCDNELVYQCLDGIEDEAPQTAKDKAQDLIIPEEWRAFHFPDSEQRSDDPFFIELVEKHSVPDELNYGVLEYLGQITLAHRLREVRALEGFERLKNTGNKIIPSDLGNTIDWLPAIEVFGEGVFFSLDEDRLQDWEQKQKDFLSPRIEKSTQYWKKNNLTFLPEPSARFVLLHTLSHLLMRQISFECGYSSSSLRERIYSELPGATHGPMAGILVYTADSDSEGSLGGLADQGRIERFIPNMLAALYNSEWCSNDPICSEIEGQGLGGLNRAACHACALVSETSCVYGNALLDRTLLLGTKGKSEKFEGFFEQLLSKTLDS